MAGFTSGADAQTGNTPQNSFLAAFRDYASLENFPLTSEVTQDFINGLTAPEKVPDHTEMLEEISAATPDDEDEADTQRLHAVAVLSSLTAVLRELGQ